MNHIIFKFKIQLNTSNLYFMRQYFANGIKLKLVNYKFFSNFFCTFIQWLKHNIISNIENQNSSYNCSILGTHIRVLSQLIMIYIGLDPFYACDQIYYFMLSNFWSSFKYINLFYIKNLVADKSQWANFLFLAKSTLLTSLGERRE